MTRAIRIGNKRSRRDRARGFTLVELLVAMIAGLFVLFAAFLLSRGATRVFGSESRLSTTQLNLRLGVDRLRNDLERSGFMSSSNVVSDPETCPDPATTGNPVRIQSLWLKQGNVAKASLETPQNVVNSLRPDEIWLQGNYATTDTYLIAGIDDTSAEIAIYLQRNNGAMQRLINLAKGSSDPATFYQRDVFRAGSMLRLTNQQGSSQYLLIVRVGMSANGTPIVFVSRNPALTRPGMIPGNPRCGAPGLCIGCTINPISTVGYSIRTLKADTLFAWAYPSGATANASETTRYDLIRQEYDIRGNPYAQTTSIVAEYAVDLAFGFSVDESAVQPDGSWIRPNVINYAAGDPNAATRAGDTRAAGVGAGVMPQRIRSVNFRLTTRSRDIDRSNAGPGIAPFLLRYEVSPGRFTRARILTGEVILPNQQRYRW